MFRNCLKFETFPEGCKKGNVVPVHKKDNKQILYNYRAVFLLYICFKVFEKLVFETISAFMIESNLLSSTQSGFKPNRTCVNQLISITCSI